MLKDTPVTAPPAFCSQEDASGVLALVSRLREVARLARSSDAEGEHRPISNGPKRPTHETRWTIDLHGDPVTILLKAERSAGPNHWSHRKLVDHIEIGAQSSSPHLRSFCYRAPVSDDEEGIPPVPSIRECADSADRAADLLQAGLDAIAAAPASIHAGPPGSHPSTKVAAPASLASWNARRHAAAVLLRSRATGSTLRTSLEITAETPWSKPRAMLVQEEFSSAPHRTLPDDVAAAICDGMPAIVCLAKEEDTHPPRWTLSATRFGPMPLADLPDSPLDLAQTVRDLPARVAEVLTSGPIE